jgi:2-alkyl-3-oxoalkanoate reductase
VPLLRDGGWRVRALTRRRSVPAADEAARGDLGDPESLRRAASGTDAVIHLAAVTHARSARAYELVNVDGTRELLSAAGTAGIRRFVHVSTRAISPTGGWYSASKHRAEELVRAAGLPFVIVRLPDVYGAGGHEGVDRALEAARSGRRVPMVGRGEDEVCPVHVDDALSAIVQAVSSPQALGKTYTLAGECVSFRELLETEAATRGVPANLAPVPRSLVALAGVAARAIPLPLFPDQLARLQAPKPPPTPEAESDLAFRPRGLAQGLADLRPARRP